MGHANASKVTVRHYSMSCPLAVSSCSARRCRA